MTMKLLPPMSPQHFEALVKLVNAGAQAAGLQAHVEIHLAGAVLSAVQDVPEPKAPAAPKRKRRG